MYDGYPVLRFLYQHNYKLKPFMRGQKILELKLKGHNVYYRDTFNFLAFPLSKFAESFGLLSTKGHFPILLNGKTDFEGGLFPEKK